MSAVQTTTTYCLLVELNSPLFLPCAGVVGCDAVASVLGMPAEQSQLLLDMVAAVSNEPSSSTAGGVDVYALSLLLMAQLHKRETQKPETADHWPELSSTGGRVACFLISSIQGRSPLKSSHLLGNGPCSRVLIAYPFLEISV